MPQMDLLFWKADAQTYSAICDEIDLMSRLSRRDPDALAQIFDEYVPAMYGLLLRITSDRALSDDLLQEALVKLWTRAAQFDGARGSLRSWLLVLVRNLAVDYFRSVRGRLSRNCSTETPPERFSDIDEESKVHSSYLVAGALRNLPPHEKKTVELAYFHGYTQSEIAQLMGIPLGTVKTWTRSALARMREALAPTFPVEKQTAQSALLLLTRPPVVAF
jgi:RNA polymerase sigma-70 factor, ECF subfamily